MDSPDDRARELIAASLADDLTPEEASELDQLRRLHPWIDEQIASMRKLTERLASSGLTWRDATPDAGLRERITTRGECDQSHTDRI